MAQAKRRPTDAQRSLRREEEEELSTQREPSCFELVDQAVAKNKRQLLSASTTQQSKQLRASKAQNNSSENGRPQFRRPHTHLLVSQRQPLPVTPLPESNADHGARLKRRTKIEKKEERLLEQRIKDIEADLRNLGASRQDVRETHNEGIRDFFRKARRWRAEKIENDVLQQIEDEDVELNETLCAQRMRASNGMDKIWERYDQDFLAQPRNRIHRLDKARFEKWAEESGYTYTPIQVPPSQSLLDNLYQQRRDAKELFYVGKEDEAQYIEDIALLRRVKMREQGRVPPEDVTEEEFISSESDPEPDLNDNEDFPYSWRQTQPKPKRQAEDHKDTIVHEHTTRSGRVTSFKLPPGLQRDGTQIRKTRQ